MWGLIQPEFSRHLSDSLNSHPWSIRLTKPIIEHSPLKVVFQFPVSSLFVITLYRHNKTKPIAWLDCKTDDAWDGGQRGRQNLRAHCALLGVAHWGNPQMEYQSFTEAQRSIVDYMSGYYNQTRPGRINIMVGFHLTKPRISSRVPLNPWPILLDHYNCRHRRRRNLCYRCHDLIKSRECDGQSNHIRMRNNHKSNTCPQYFP